MLSTSFRIKIFILLIAIVLGNCVTKDVVSAGDSNSQILAAANFLANKCGTTIPQPIPLAVSDVYRRNLDLCSIAITKSECPFVGYPVACLFIYFDKPAEQIPWYINYKDSLVTPKIP
ncbi:hypothetical protein CH373_06880 [Leptospira perolatii]|uniref:Uncharacterized protein n=1 Tax=Leptospira perolatii TaxID=2023191 RepID=A0A2M9ZP77_9LEPT|nr:hypothetical protein [Leptospira perolatii]PJZ70656.1 hypothetical protein CH360_03740 [Leptospira perolatii]PJZ73867.1 hypothetical protein CH373_06880 [Leptospira perolatii]